MSLEEFTKNYFFDYDYRAIKYLADKYQMKIDVVKTYLKNLYFVEEKNYDNEKLQLLVKYKEELSDNNLLIKNPLFTTYLKKWDKITVLGYGRLNKFYKNILDNLNGEIVEFKFNQKEFNFIEFQTMEKEVQYLYNSISKFLEYGIDINNIYVMNADKSYETFSIAIMITSFQD